MVRTAAARRAARTIVAALVLAAAALAALAALPCAAQARYASEVEVGTFDLTVGAAASTEVTLTYDGNPPAESADVSGVPQSQTLSAPGTLTVSSAVPTCEGYDFLGWSPNPALALLTGTYVAPGTTGYALDKSATLYAVWQKKAASGDSSADSDTLTLYVQRLNDDGSTYNVYSSYTGSYSGYDTSTGTPYATSDEKDVGSGVALGNLGTVLNTIAADAGKAEVKVYVVNGIVVASNATIKLSANYDFTFMRYEGYAGPVFETVKESGDAEESGRPVINISPGPILRLSNLTIDGTVAAGTENVYPLVYSSSFDGTNVVLTNVVLQNNARTFSDEEQCNYGSAISLYSSSAPDSTVGSVEIPESAAPEEFTGRCMGSPTSTPEPGSGGLYMYVCTVRACTGSEGAVFVDTVNSMHWLEMDGCTFDGSTAYPACVLYQNAFCRGTNGYYYPYLGSNSFGQGDIHYHMIEGGPSETTTTTHSVLVGTHTDGANSFYLNDERFGGGFVGSTSDLKIVLKPNTTDDKYTFPLDEWVVVSVDGTRYVVYRDGSSELEGATFSTDAGGGSATLTVSTEILEKASTMVVSAYLYSSVSPYVPVTTASTALSCTMASDGTVQVVYALEPSDGYETFYDDSATIYVWASTEPASTEYYALATGTRGDDGTYTFTYDGGYASTGWCSATYYSDAEALVVTVTGKTTELLRYANEVYISTATPKETTVVSGGTGSGAKKAARRSGAAVSAGTSVSASGEVEFGSGGTSVEDFLASRTTAPVGEATEVDAQVADADLGDSGAVESASAEDSRPDEPEAGGGSAGTDGGGDGAEEATVAAGDGQIETAEPAETDGETSEGEQAEAAELTAAADGEAEAGRAETSSPVATAASAEARVLLAQAGGSAGTVSASWSGLSVSDDGLVSGSLLVEVDGGAAPTAAWAAVLPEGWSGTDADAWAAAADGGALVYSSDPSAALSQGTGISFAWRPDASAGVLTLEGVPSSGLVDGDGVLRVALCLAGDSLADASPSAVASALACGSAACAAWSGAVQAGWSNASLDVDARLSGRAAALAEAARAAEEAAEAERLAAEQAAAEEAARAAAEQAAAQAATAEGGGSDADTTGGDQTVTDDTSGGGPAGGSTAGSAGDPGSDTSGSDPSGDDQTAAVKDDDPSESGEQPDGDGGDDEIPQ